MAASRYGGLYDIRLRKGKVKCAVCRACRCGAGLAAAGRFFSWQLEAVEGPADTSATGMICVGLKQGIAAGVLAGEKYENALTAGSHALERSVRDGRVYRCSGECEGFSRYPQCYGAYPWSLGPALEVFRLGADKGHTGI